MKIDKGEEAGGGEGVRRAGGKVGCRKERIGRVKSGFYLCNFVFQFS